MSRKVFVNLPVSNLQRSMAFFCKLGFTFNEKFTDDSAACMVISDENYAMLITHKRFKDFTPHEICDSSRTEVLVALSCDSREEVDTMADMALAAGGSPVRDVEDHGFMYARSFHDPDGHIWEPLWLDPAAA
jgi:uncharacterized protein